MSKTDEMEQPAKQWQMASIETELKAMNVRMEQILRSIENFATHKDLEDAGKAQQEYTDSQVSLIEAKISPILKLFWALVTGLVMTVATLVVQFITQIKGH